MNCSRPGSSDHGISQARILEWVAIPSSRGILPTQGSNPVSRVSCIGRRMLTTTATREACVVSRLRRYTFRTHLDSSVLSGVPRRPPRTAVTVASLQGGDGKGRKSRAQQHRGCCLPVLPPPPLCLQRRALWTCLVPKHFPCSRSLQAQTSCPPVRPSVQHWSMWKSRPRVEVSRGQREGGFLPGVTEMLREHGFPQGVTEMLRDLAWGLRTRKGGLLGQPEDSISGRLLTTRGLCSQEKAG